jgi:hypothetical protein
MIRFKNCSNKDYMPSLYSPELLVSFSGRRELSQSEEVTPIAGAPTAIAVGWRRRRIPAGSVKVKNV